ncbi:MAG: hypothetical protein IT436_05235 [Phycisphaerales bacterium]|nr:hypothetical protein [Phycisphaerales bacterium]
MTTYDGPDFSLARVQTDYGAGVYYAQIKRGTRTHRGVVFSVGPAPRSAGEPAAKPASAAVAVAPAPAADPVVAMMSAQLERQQAMILALLNRPQAPAVPADPLAGLDRVMKLVQPRTQIAEVVEAMRAVRELAAAEAGAGVGGGGGAEWGSLIQSLPTLIQAFAQQQQPGGASIDNHPAVRKARQIVAAFEARKSAALPVAAHVAPVAAPSSPLPPAPAAAVPPADDFRIAWVREAVPMLRLVLTLPDIDVDTYAQVCIDAIEARGATVGEVVGHPGELVRIVLTEAPDLAAHVGTLAKLESAIRECDQPDESEPMGGAIDDDGHPRAGDPRQYPSSPKTPAA